MSNGPWSYEDARAACQSASRMQQSAEDGMREASVSYAKAEEAYRVALATAIVTKHDEGAAWTVAPDLARGDATVARLRRERDIAEGVRDAMQQAAWRRAADRKDAQRFSDWSQRVEMRDQGGTTNWDLSPIIGGKRA